jgi:hypothetical protein
MASGTALDRLARAVKSSGNPAWLPRVPQTSFHQGTVTGVDLGNGVLDFQFADPSGIVVPGVRFLQSYSPTYAPQEGHIVWMQMYGTDPMVIGQHVPSTGFLVP